MKVERLERVCLAVKNLEAAVKLFSSLFDTTFEMCPADTLIRKPTKHADPSFETIKIRLAISPLGLELLESDPPAETEGVRSFHFKVPNLEEAKAEMEAKGVRLLTEVIYGNLKEAVFCPDDLSGARLVLTEFDAPSAVDAILQR